MLFINKTTLSHRLMENHLSSLTKPNTWEHMSNPSYTKEVDMTIEIIDRKIVISTNESLDILSYKLKMTLEVFYPSIINGNKQVSSFKHFDNLNKMSQTYIVALYSEPDIIDYIKEKQFTFENIKMLTEKKLFYKIVNKKLSPIKKVQFTILEMVYLNHCDVLSMYKILKRINLHSLEDVLLRLDDIVTIPLSEERKLHITKLKHLEDKLNLNHLAYVYGSFTLTNSNGCIEIDVDSVVERGKFIINKLTDLNDSYMVLDSCIDSVNKLIVT